MQLQGSKPHRGSERFLNLDQKAFAEKAFATEIQLGSTRLNIQDPLAETIQTKRGLTDIPTGAKIFIEHVKQAHRLTRCAQQALTKGTRTRSNDPYKLTGHNFGGQRRQTNRRRDTTCPIGQAHTQDARMGFLRRPTRNNDALSQVMWENSPRCGIFYNTCQSDRIDKTRSKFARGRPEAILSRMSSLERSCEVLSRLAAGKS